MIETESPSVAVLASEARKTSFVYSLILHGTLYSLWIL